MKCRQLCCAIMALAVVMMLGVAAVEAQPAGKMRGKGRRGPDKAPKVGDDAPNFKLKSLDGKRETELATFKGEKPVVLIFGSYT